MQTNKDGYQHMPSQFVCLVRPVVEVNTKAGGKHL